MAIKKLPEYVINRLKAWEVVNRPANVLKELVENSIDAWSTYVEVNIKDWWKNLLSVLDNWEWIQLSDMDLLLERYATSKIQSDEDLQTIASYGFRWEALASIAEVSKVTIMSKTAYSEIWTKLTKRWNEHIINHVPVPFKNGTSILVEDLFYNVPARLKFLKSSQTEFYYCYNYFVDVALWHYDKSFVLKKNDKISFDLKPTDSLIDRINDVYKKDWTKNLSPLQYKDDDIEITWVVSDPSIRFGSAENIKIYVNSRPVQDKIVYKALIDAYRRQITPGEFPLVVLMINIDSSMVDVNVHPSKQQVKFLDSQKIYQIVFDTVQKCLWDNKISNVSSFVSDWSFWNNYFGKSIGLPKQNVFLGSKDLHDKQETNIFSWDNFKSQDFSLSNNDSLDKVEEQNIFNNQQIWDYQIVWQIWNSYIVLQSNDALYYIDQHALAERISFESMKKNIDTKKELLLQPVKFNVVDLADLDKKIEKLNEMWFDCSMLSDGVMVVYAVPKVFVTYPVDLEKLFNHVLYLEDITFDHVLDWIFATKACKTSIKAWHKLSYQQMSNLVKDGFEQIDWMFVCQHWRPFFVKVDKKKVDELFDR